jgi:hypothetical protein
MKAMFRRLAAVTSAVLAASALTLPVAQPAQAAAPTEKAFVVESVDGDFWTGLYTRPVPSGGRTAVVADPGLHHIYSISSSRDGSRVIYGQINYSRSTGEAVNRQIIVRDVSTRVVRVLDTLPYDPEWSIGNPALSPDGTRASWDLHHVPGYSPVHMRTANVGIGVVTTWKDGFSPHAFLDNDNLIVQTRTGVPYTVPFAGGTAHSVAGLPVNAFEVTVAPDGNSVAYALDVSSSTGPARTRITVAPLTSSNGIASLGAATTLTSGAHDFNPAYSTDGSKLFFVRDAGTETASGDIWVVPADGSNPASVTAATGSDERDVVITTTDDGTPPGTPMFDVPFTLNGTSATLRWTLPNDSDLSGVIITPTTGDSIYVPAPRSYYVVKGLALGFQYTYTIRAVDRSNHSSVSTSDRSLRAIAPGAYFGDPTSTFSTKASFPVRFAVGDHGSEKYDVKYLPYGGTLKTWVEDAAGVNRTFGVAGNGTTVADTSSVAGGSYRFAVKVTDPYGNTSGTVVSGQAVVPYDETKASYAGASLLHSSTAYLGSYRRMTSTSAYAKVTLVGNRLQVVGYRCSSCGSFAIYDGSTKVGTVSTYASSTVARAVLFTKTYAGNATHTFTIRPLGTAGHPAVALDGFAMRRT